MRAAAAWISCRRKRPGISSDWRKKQQARAQVLLTVQQVLDELPRAYTPAIYQRKCDEVYQHIYDSYYGQGQSVYAEAS